MAGHVLKVDGTEVALEGPERTTVHITLRQESGLASLCRGAALGLRKAAAKDGQDAGQAPRPAGGEQKVLGLAQCLLGATCIGLGTILGLAPPRKFLDYSHRDHHYNWAFYNGVPFWMGSLFMLSGIFSVEGAGRGGSWVRLATFLNLGSVVAGSVAFTLGLTDVGPLNGEPYFVAGLCRHSRRATGGHLYDSKEDRQRAMQCYEALWGLVRMWSGTQILLLIVHVAALATALFCFGYGLRRLCFSCWGVGQDRVADEEPDDAPVAKEPGKAQSPAWGGPGGEGSPPLLPQPGEVDLLIPALPGDRGAA